jgi:hypothetical protein
LSGMANPLPSDWGFFPAPASPAFQSLPPPHSFLCGDHKKSNNISLPAIIHHSSPLHSVDFSQTLSAGRISTNKTLLRACQQIGTHVHTSVGLVPKQAPPSMNKGYVTLRPCHLH